MQQFLRCLRQRVDFSTKFVILECCGHVFLFRLSPNSHHTRDIHRGMNFTQNERTMSRRAPKYWLFGSPWGEFNCRFTPGRHGELLARGLGTGGGCVISRSYKCLSWSCITCLDSQNLSILIRNKNTSYEYKQDNLSWICKTCLHGQHLSFLKRVWNVNICYFYLEIKILMNMYKKRYSESAVTPLYTTIIY